MSQWLPSRKVLTAAFPWGLGVCYLLSKSRCGLQNQDLGRQWKGDFRIRQTPGFKFGSACNTQGDLGPVSKSPLPCLTSSRVTDIQGLWRKQDSAGRGQLKSMGGTPSSGWAVLRKLRKPTGPAPYLISFRGPKRPNISCIRWCILGSLQVPTPIHR